MGSVIAVGCHHHSRYLLAAARGALHGKTNRWEPISYRGYRCAPLLTDIIVDSQYWIENLVLFGNGLEAKQVSEGRR